MNLESKVVSNLQGKLHLLQARMAAQPFLKGLSTSHLATLGIYAMETEFTRGQLIFRQGDMANRFYLLEQGNVALKVRVHDHPPVLLQTVGPGEVLGWSWLFPPFSWHFDAEAIDPVKAIFFYGTRLREHCEEDPGFGHDLMQRVAEVAIGRLNQLQRTVVQLSLKQ